MMIRAFPLGTYLEREITVALRQVTWTLTSQGKAYLFDRLTLVVQWIDYESLLSWSLSNMLSSLYSMNVSQVEIPALD